MTPDITQNFSGLLSFNKVAQNPLTQLTRVYDKHERAAIDVFKKDYMEASTPTARKLVCQHKVFPALFNYWESIGEVLNEDQIVVRSKVS